MTFHLFRCRLAERIASAISGCGWVAVPREYLDRLMLSWIRNELPVRHDTGYTCTACDQPVDPSPEQKAKCEHALTEVFGERKQ